MPLLAALGTGRAAAEAPGKVSTAVGGVDDRRGLATRQSAGRALHAPGLRLLVAFHEEIEAEAALRCGLDSSAVLPAVEGQRSCLAGANDERRGGCCRPVRSEELELRAELERSCRKSIDPARRVADRERSRRGDRERAPALGQEDAHLLGRRGAELDARVVVLEDPVVRVPGLGHPEGAVLAHPDAVAIPLAGDDEERLSRDRGRRSRLGRRCRDDDRKGESG